MANQTFNWDNNKGTFTVAYTDPASGNKTLTITSGANTDVKKRTATLTVTTSDSAISKAITVSQQGALDFNYTTQEVGTFRGAITNDNAETTSYHTRVLDPDTTSEDIEGFTMTGAKDQSTDPKQTINPTTGVITVKHVQSRNLSVTATRGSETAGPKTVWVSAALPFGINDPGVEMVTVTTLSNNGYNFTSDLEERGLKMPSIGSTKSTKHSPSIEVQKGDQIIIETGDYVYPASSGNRFQGMVMFTSSDIAPYLEEGRTNLDVYETQTSTYFGGHLDETRPVPYGNCTMEVTGDDTHFIMLSPINQDYPTGYTTNQAAGVPLYRIYIKHATNVAPSTDTSLKVKNVATDMIEGGMQILTPSIDGVATTIDNIEYTLS